MQVRVRLDEFVGHTDHPEMVECHIGKWLVDYDPLTERIGSVDNPQHARVFPSYQLAKAYLLRYGRLRDDGEPDRPIMAFKLTLIAATSPN